MHYTIVNEPKVNQLKLVMMGAAGAGKTSSVQSLLDKKFNDDEASTVRVSINCYLIDWILICRQMAAYFDR